MGVFKNRTHDLQNFVASLAVKSIYIVTGKHPAQIEKLDYTKDSLSEKEIMQENIDYVVKILDSHYSEELQSCITNSTITEKLARLWYKYMIKFFRNKIAEIVKHCYGSKNINVDERTRILTEYAAKYNSIMNSIGKKYSVVKIRNQCSVTGRRRGYIRKLGITRKIVRKNVPLVHGLIKSSW